MSVQKIDVCQTRFFNDFGTIALHRVHCLPREVRDAHDYRDLRQCETRNL